MAISETKIVESTTLGNSLVSVIMPAYNAEEYIEAAIQSVILQSYPSWELLIVNDGSTDRTEDVVRTFRDRRISYFRQNNEGVSAARNAGLEKSKGEYICFLDSDDVLSPDSLIARVLFFQNNPSVDFVDGTIYLTEKQIHITRQIWKPSFRGVPTRELVRLKDTCFATNSWMIRAQAIGNVRFRKGVTHGEDLIFLAEISFDRYYDFVSVPILYFRRSGSSAMSDLDGLSKGYLHMSNVFKELRLFKSPQDRFIHKFRVMKVMFLSYVAAGKTKKALQFMLKAIMS